MEFKDRLRLLRTYNRMTQKKLAKILGYGYTAISNYEAGRNEPSIKDLIRLAHFFNVSLDYLMGHDRLQEIDYDWNIGEEIKSNHTDEVYVVQNINIVYDSEGTRNKIIYELNNKRYLYLNI